MRALFIKLSVLIMLFVTACGGDSSSEPGSSSGDSTGPEGANNPATSGPLLFYGLIGISDDTSANEVNVSGGFFRFSSGITTSAFKSGVGTLNHAPDTCEITVSDTNINEAEEVDFDVDIPNTSSSLVSAGEVIPFTSAAGTFAELQRTVILGVTTYTLAGNLSGGLVGPVPDALSFDIPGDLYPAFPNVAVPDIISIAILNPTVNSPITGDTVFSWEASPDSLAAISIKASGFTQTIINNVPVVSSARLSCDVIDDGNFALPAITQSELAVSNINFTFNSISRTLTRLQQTDTAALFVTRTSRN